MSTINRNAIVFGPVASGFKQMPLPCADSTNPINAGDLVYLDTSAHVVKTVDTDSHAASFVGVALQPSHVSSNLDNGTIPGQAGIMVAWDAVVSMKTTAAETYYTGDAVYIGADAQTIQKTTGTNKIGTVILPVGVASLVGATGVYVQIYIKSIAI